MAACEILRFKSLVLTVSHSPTEGYEVLVEVDKDEAAPSVPVALSFPSTGDEIEVGL